MFLCMQIFKKLFYLFIFDCTGSLLLCLTAALQLRYMGLLTEVASLVAHRLQVHGLQQVLHAGFGGCGFLALGPGGFRSCGTRAPQLWLIGPRVCIFSSYGPQAQLLCGEWTPPGPGIELVSLVAGGFLSTVPTEREVSIFDFLRLLLKQNCMCSESAKSMH